VDEFLGSTSATAFVSGAGGDSGSDSGPGNLDPDSPIDSGGNVVIQDERGDTVDPSAVETQLRDTLYDRQADQPVGDVSCDAAAPPLEDGDELLCHVTLAGGQDQPIRATALHDNEIGSWSVRIDLR
jgi:uncharacterized protein DUF4333